MNISMEKIAQSIGLKQELFDRWKANAAIVAKEDPTDTVYHLDGPIVSTDVHASMGYMEGLCSPSSLQSFLKANKGKDIEIDINSPGGSVFDGNAMYTMLLRHTGDITINVIGTCYSAATFFLALPNAHRVAFDGADFMVHRAWTIAIGNEGDMEKIAEQLRKTDENIAQRLARTTDYDAKTIRDMMDSDTYFNAQEAYEGGFVDELVGGDDIDDMESAEDDDDEMKNEVETDDEFVKPTQVNEAEQSIIGVIGLYN